MNIVSARRRDGPPVGMTYTKVLTGGCSGEDPPTLKLEPSFNRKRSVRGKIMAYFFWGPL